MRARRRLRLVVLGLSLSSSWGNGHATTYRALLRAMARRGHDIVFLERDVPWYAANRDLAEPDFCRLALYRDLAELACYRAQIAAADAVIVGSYVPDGIAVGRLVQETACGTAAFYDIDTPVTLAQLERGECEYLAPALIAGYDIYLSFSGGPILQRLADRYGAPLTRALPCAVDAAVYRPLDVEPRWDLGYLGTYSADRQSTLERLLLEPARRAPHLRMVVAGPQYPSDIVWPKNVDRIEHVAPAEHPGFHAACRYALNVTRADMIRAGHSPSVRLFEAAACGTPLITDAWPGLGDFLLPGKEILVAESAEDVLGILREVGERQREAIATAARRRVLHAHTADVRAIELENALAAAGAPGRSDPREPQSWPAAAQ